MRKVIKSLGLSLLVLSGVFCLFSCNNEIIPPVIEATPSVKGTISLPASSGLFPEDIWVKVVENETTKYVGRVNSDATFSVSGLDAAKKYDVMFTSIEPEQQNVSREFKSRAASTTNGFGGWLSDVSASIDDANIGSVKIKPLGTINGKAIRSGAVDNYDVMVYIPGTSFMAMTNEDGSFSIANVPQGTHRLRYTSDDYMSQMKEKVLLFSDDDTVNPVTTVSDVILIKNAGILKGYATLNGAASNAGIIIKLEGDNATGSEIGTTASDGSFSIPDVKPGIYSALFSYAGYIDQKVENLVIEAAKTTSLPSSVSLTANGGTITGTVRQNDGAAGTGASVLAKVTIGEADFTYSSTVDADGKFTLNDCRPADGYSITVSKTGFASVVRSGISLTVEGIILPEVMLSSEFGGLSGYVQDSEMNAINGAQINIGEYTAFTNSEGYFIKSDLPLGQYTVTLSKDGYTTKTLAQKVSIESNKTATIGTQMLSSMYGSVSGTVQASSGSPLSGALVLLKGTSEYTATTDENGAFAKDGIAIGSYEVTISKDGYGTLTLATAVSVESSKTTSVGITRLKSLYGSLSGTVKLQGAMDYSGILGTISGLQTYTASTTIDGSYSISALLPGTYSVILSKAGFVSTTITDVVITADTNTIVAENVLVSSSCGISGRVVLEGSTGNAGAIVSASYVGDSSKVYSTTTLEDGTYSFTGLDAGQYSMKMQMTGFVTDNSQLITTAYGEVSLVPNVTLKSVTSTVNGDITLSGSIDHTGINVLFKATDESRQYDVTTDQSGVYTITKVQPGVYDLYASKSGYETKTVEDITIEPTSTKTIDSISLAVAQRSIYGNVQLELSTDHAGALVTATKISDPDKVYSAISNSAGDYSLAGMEPGEYRIVITSAGYRTLTLPTTDVIASSTADLGTANLIVARGTISGIVTLEGRSSQEGTRVELLGTEYETVTNELGEYSFSVPQGNYPGGIRFTRTDFKAGSHADTIPVLTDSTYAVPARELKATHASMEGSVTVLGTTDASGVVVSIEGTDFSMATPSDGSYRFDHVPLGSYTIRFTYVNTPLMTASVILGAVESVTIAPMSMRPDQASIKGFASLKGLTSYAGIEVKVVNTETDEILSTRTSADGSFHIGGILTTGAYTVEFSKPGWDGHSLSVTGLTPLEERDITASQTIELVDTTAPLLTGVSINDGGNTTSNPTVSLKIEAYEQGSGIRKMRVSWDGTFDTESWIAYAAIAESTITNTSNGDKTVSVQIEDLAGNRASATASATITLTDQVKAVSGILEAGELHWTKAESPILVAGDVIVNTGDTLVIDPGVDVQFNGMFAISIRGKLEAIGTAEEPIVFKPAVDSGYTGKWNGITAGSNTLSVNETNYAYTLNEGSIIQHARILDTEKGIRGRILLKDSYIETDGYALGESSNNERFSGYAVGNIIIGSVNFGGTVFNNQMNGDNGRLYGYGAKIINNLFSNYNVLTLYYLSRFDFNTLQEISKLYPLYGVWELKSTPSNNIFTGIEQTILLESHESVFRDMIFSNIYDNLGNPEIKVNTPWSSLSSHNWRYNYWGDAHTLELQALKASNKNNASFIYDAYDNPDVSVIDWSNFLSEPIVMAGYQGESFCDFAVNFNSTSSYNQQIAVVGQPVEFTLEAKTSSEILKYRIAQDYDSLIASDWKTYSHVAVLGEVDSSKLRNGWLDVYFQIEDENNIQSQVKYLSVGYSKPTIVDINFSEDSTLTTDAVVNIQTTVEHIENLAVYTWLEVFLDETQIYSEGGMWGARRIAVATFNPESLLDGEHVLTFKLFDSAGNYSITSREFILDRPAPIASNLIITGGSTIAEDESLDFSIDVAQASRLKTLRILANGNEMKKMSYVDNGSSDFTFESSIASVYLPKGESTLSVELTDYVGNIALYELGSFTVSGTGADPVIDNVSIADGTVFNTYTDTNLTFTASDSGGVRLIRVLLNGEEIRPPFSALAYSDTLKVRDIDMAMNIPYRKNGTYVLAIEATDFAGNKTVDERTITIERALPTATFSMNAKDLYDDGTFSVNYSIQDAQTLAYFQLLVDGHQLKYDGYHGLSTERSSTSGSWSWDVENLPAGTHEVTMRVVDIAGNETVTTAQQVVVHRTIVDSDYGVGLTWDTDGTLLQDWSTHYLWDFDNPSARGLDTAGGVLNGDVRQTTVGLGGTATRFYINQNVETQFPDASWTVEYWAKMEHISTYSHFTFGLENVFSTDIIKSSTSNHSYSNSYFIYQTPAGIDLSQASVQGYTSRENRSEWHHYAWVSTGNGLFFYIDGLLVAKLEDKMSNILATRVYIYSDYIDNFMDEIRISMRARSVDELWSYVQYAKDKLPVD